MQKNEINRYGNLCVEMYEILHREAPSDELNFYLSYAQAGKKILEPLCGSGRFLVPFAQTGLDIFGVDSSREMLDKLHAKYPAAKFAFSTIENFQTEDKFDYIFITSGSMSLFTDMRECKKIVGKIKALLNPFGKFVFAVDGAASRCKDDNDFKIAVSVKTDDGCDLILKTKNTFDTRTGTQYSPSFYELYDGGRLLKREFMDFRTHLYKYGEMEAVLKEVGFPIVRTFSCFDKNETLDEKAEIYLFECTV